MTSNGLQTGIMIDRADMDRMLKNVDRASDSISVKSDSSDSTLLNSDMERSVNQIDSKINAYKQSVHQSKLAPLDQEMKLRDYYLRAYDLYYSPTPDYQTAFSLFKLCQSLPEAKFFLGMCYLYRKGVNQDLEKAKGYLELSWKNAQFPIALYELGKLHDLLGNRVEAFRNFLLAANLGVPKAYGKLAAIYETGDVIYDVDEANYWKGKAYAVVH
ncbi:hypothetical protein BC833DRAFT_607884 [Globomyces pollinis-pini]|nr:hypothetical protein BC833DRAFT_607884 [Globomyces pollinis-pini]